MEELHLKTMVMVEPVLQVKDMEELRHLVKVMVELRLQVKDMEELHLQISLEELMQRCSNGSMQ